MRLGRNCSDISSGACELLRSALSSISILEAESQATVVSKAGFQVPLWRFILMQAKIKNDVE
ncbi:hypothetical protein KC19_9G040300 [Ceratodon purpureus]|uniref:Uncharacterized protein n=1 Tax=Ceratodon purpureus TaxID=3225 RepID=A0A8T0GSK4_CERPU|nr:hypothetical protein KC19_9G040300 [Ceratodon purpureus]